MDITQYNSFLCCWPFNLQMPAVHRVRVLHLLEWTLTRHFETKELLCLGRGMAGSGGGEVWLLPVSGIKPATSGSCAQSIHHSATRSCDKNNFIDVLAVTYPILSNNRLSLTSL